MPYEVWGTFSVADHLRKRPFVADVVLYDKLVIPVVPKDDDSLRNLWRHQGRQPEKQEKYIDILGSVNPNLVWTIPWDRRKNEAFKSRFEAARGIAFDTHNLATTHEVDPDRPAFHVTRLVLEDYARDPKNLPDLPPGIWVDPMAAYPSYQAFSEEVSVRVGRKKPTTAESHLAGVFGWEFIVPDEPKMSDEDILRITAQLTSDGSFKEKRRAFHDWRRKVIAQGITEKAALEEMSTLVQEYNDVVRRSRLRTRVVNGFAIAEIAASIAASFAVPAAGVVGAFLGVGLFGAEKWIPGSEPSPDQRAAAMFHDVRKRFGWRQPRTSSSS